MKLFTEERNILVRWLFVITILIIGCVAIFDWFNNKIETEQIRYNLLSQEYDELLIENEAFEKSNQFLQEAKDKNKTLLYLGEFKCVAYCGEAYNHICNDGENYGRTFTGTIAQSNWTIAVDPTVIPLGSTVYIDGIGTRIAEDTGGAIKGNKIDIFFDKHQDALNFSTQFHDVWILLNN